MCPESWACLVRGGVRGWEVGDDGGQEWFHSQGC